jgi:hypothetical protein
MRSAAGLRNKRAAVDDIVIRPVHPLYTPIRIKVLLRGPVRDGSDRAKLSTQPCAA